MLKLQHKSQPIEKSFQQKNFKVFFLENYLKSISLGVKKFVKIHQFGKGNKGKRNRFIKTNKRQF